MADVFFSTNHQIVTMYILEEWYEKNGNGNPAGIGGKLFCQNRQSVALHSVKLSIRLISEKLQQQKKIKE